MNRVLKKIAIYTGAVMLATFVLFLICLPFGIKSFMNDIASIETKMETKEANANITKAVISVNDYCDIRFRQSKNGKFYVEVFEGAGDISNFSYIENKVELTENGNIAYLDIEKDYENSKKFTKDTFNQFVSREFFYHPDVIVYIPENIEIETKGEYQNRDLVYSDIDFANKETVKAEIEAENQREMELSVNQNISDIQAENDALRIEMENMRSELMTEISILREELYNEIYNNQTATEMN